MEKVYRFLKTAVWCFIGVFIGTSAYQCYDYHRNSWVYELTSSPWYTSILATGLFTAILVAILLVLMFILKKKMR